MEIYIGILPWALLIGAAIGWYWAGKLNGPTTEEQILRIVEAMGDAISKATGTWSSGIVTPEEQDTKEVKMEAEWVLPELDMDDPWMRVDDAES